MKTQIEMAHEWAMKHGNAETIGSRQNMIKYAWEYADAMQAEADKRTKITGCDMNINTDMYLEYDASIIYPPDAYVMYKGEKRLAISIKEEFQPDWSQAPDWANFLVMTCGGTSFWNAYEPILSGLGWVGGGNCVLAHLDYYKSKSDWRNSLRKRPD